MYKSFYLIRFALLVNFSTFIVQVMLFLLAKLSVLDGERFQNRYTWVAIMVLSILI